jgi:hypothetical protein
MSGRAGAMCSQGKEREGVAEPQGVGGATRACGAAGCEQASWNFTAEALRRYAQAVMRVCDAYWLQL